MKAELCLVTFFVVADTDLCGKLMTIDQVFDLMASYILVLPLVNVGMFVFGN